MHLVTLPLFAVPSLDDVPAVWAVFNVAALLLSFVCTLALLGGLAQGWARIGVLAAMWMGFQPLVNCLSAGNIEIAELAFLMGGLATLWSGRAALGGSLIGVATMVKYLPGGFVVWLALRGARQPVIASLLAIGVIALAAQATLGWEHSTTVLRVPGRVTQPFAGFHQVSITSAFLHRAAVIRPGPRLTWPSAEQRQRALRAGLAASALIGLAYSVLVWRRRHLPPGPSQVGVLFVLMVVLPPWNHDYYYVFLAVPLAIALVTALDRPHRRRAMVGAVLVAYALMSPPVPYGFVDRLGWFDMRFSQTWNFYDMPLYGALLLLAVSTFQWLTPGETARPRSAREGYWFVETGPPSTVER